MFAGILETSTKLTLIAFICSPLLYEVTMDTLIVTISKDSLVSIKPLSQTSSVLVNNLLKKCSFLGKYISSQYTSKPLQHL